MNENERGTFKNSHCIRKILWKLYSEMLTNGEWLSYWVSLRHTQWGYCLQLAAGELKSINVRGPKSGLYVAKFRAVAKIRTFPFQILFPFFCVVSYRWQKRGKWQINEQGTWATLQTFGGVHAINLHLLRWIIREQRASLLEKAPAAIWVVTRGPVHGYDAI